MGSDAENVLFSPRHWYLGCAALAGIIIFVVRGRALLRQADSVRDLKRMLSLGLDALPLRARGARYYVLTAGLQLTIGALTQIGEGCPFCSHDVVGGLLGAVLTVVVLALITRAIGRRLPGLVCALVSVVVIHDRSDATRFVRIVLPGPAESLGVWFPLLFNRPPPQLQYA